MTQFFTGLELLEPGVVPVQHWRQDSEIEGARRVAMWGGVGPQERLTRNRTRH